MTKCFFIYVSSITSFGIGLFWFSVALSKDMKYSLNSVKPKKKTKDMELEILKKLSKFIRIHNLSKQLSEINLNIQRLPKNYETFLNHRKIEGFSVLMQPLFMVLFTWSILSICFSMLMFRMHLVRYSIFVDFLFTFPSDEWSFSFSVKPFSTLFPMWNAISKSFQVLLIQFFLVFTK